MCANKRAMASTFRYSVNPEVAGSSPVEPDIKSQAYEGVEACHPLDLTVNLLSLRIDGLLILRRRPVLHPPRYLSPALAHTFGKPQSETVRPREESPS